MCVCVCVQVVVGRNGSFQCLASLLCLDTLLLEYVPCHVRYVRTTYILTYALLLSKQKSFWRSLTACDTIFFAHIRTAMNGSLKGARANHKHGRQLVGAACIVRSTHLAGVQPTSSHYGRYASQLARFGRLRALTLHSTWRERRRNVCVQSSPPSRPHTHSSTLA